MSIDGVTLVHGPIKKKKTSKNRYHLVLCECGSVKEVYIGDLRRVNLYRCASCAQKTHDKTGSKEHRAWAHMIQRCENPRNKSYEHYGGRGIAVCRRWRESFIAFLDDMGEAPSDDSSIDRIDVNLGYSPWNCRWASISEQNRNYRKNRYVVVHGERMVIADAMDMLGYSRSAYLKRVRRGMTHQEAVDDMLKTRGLI